jgi:hypothetical protein
MWPRREFLHTRARKSPSMQASVGYDSVLAESISLSNKANIAWIVAKVRKDTRPEPIGEGQKDWRPVP